MFNAEVNNDIKNKVPHVGLLESIRPLIDQISKLTLQLNGQSNIDEVTAENIKPFVSKAQDSLLFLATDYKISAQSAKSAGWFKQFIATKNEVDYVGKKFFELFDPCPNIIKRLVNSSLKGKSEHREVLEIKLIKQNRFIRWESFPLFNLKGEILGIMIFNEDITKRHLLSLSNKKLQQSNLMLENFAIIFSHDLVQPMRQINNYLNLMRSHLQKIDTDKEFSDFSFSAINKSMLQIRNLSEGMVLCCKNGDLTIDSKGVSLVGAIDKVRESCLLFSKARFKLEIEDDVHLYVNGICIAQLLQNLITNAVKYSPIEMTVITISATTLGHGFCEISIHNNGPFPANYIKKFETQSLSSSLDGTGLGLIICKKIVSAYKGEMSINSSLKKGTIVKISLPTK